MCEDNVPEYNPDDYDDEATRRTWLTNTIKCITNGIEQAWHTYYAAKYSHLALQSELRAVAEVLRDIEQHPDLDLVDTDGELRQRIEACAAFAKSARKALHHHRWE